MKYECTKEEFLSTIDKHEMEIFKDDGVYRHLRFSRPNDMNRYFDIVTWPGFLSVTGDMGAYQFSRTHDMFNFFFDEGTKSLSINPSYWHEKMQSDSRFGGSQEDDYEGVLENLKNYVNEHLEEYPIEDSDERVIFKEDMESFYNNFEYEESMDYCIRELYQYNSNHISFSDYIMEGVYTKRYTYHYIWICYAIVWAIEKYRNETK